jgi:RNA polymerase sigma-70 factor (ECF subfamily)
MLDHQATCERHLTDRPVGPSSRTPGSPREAAIGGTPAVDELLQRHLPSVRAWLRLRAGRLLLDKESVSDLAQSVCRDVFQNLSRFRYDGEDGFRRWLFKTAQRKIADRHAHHRAARRTPAGGQAVEPYEDARVAGHRSFHTPSRNAIAHEELERVERAIAGLPEAQQEVVLLAKVAGLSRRAIGEELGRSEEAVRMLLHRALARIGDLLADD